MHKEQKNVKYIDVSISTKYNRWKGIEVAFRDWVLFRHSKFKLYVMLAEYGIQNFTISPLETYVLPDRDSAKEYVHEWAAKLNAQFNDRL
jgi:hypothetical protein